MLASRHSSAVRPTRARRDELERVEGPGPTSSSRRTTCPGSPSCSATTGALTSRARVSIRWTSRPRATPSTRRARHAAPRPRWSRERARTAACSSSRPREARRGTTTSPDRARPDEAAPRAMTPHGRVPDDYEGPVTYSDRSPQVFLDDRARNVRAHAPATHTCNLLSAGNECQLHMR